MNTSGYRFYETDYEGDYSTIYDQEFVFIDEEDLVEGEDQGDEEFDIILDCPGFGEEIGSA
jgi:hypothetical protein